MKRIFFIIQLLLFVTFCHAQDAEVRVRYQPKKNSTYQIGEIVNISIEVVMPSKICHDGIENSNIFLSGLKIMDEKEWINVDDNLWRKAIKLKIIANKKGYSKLTVFRKADKGGFFIQEKISTQ